MCGPLLAMTAPMLAAELEQRPASKASATPRSRSLGRPGQFLFCRKIMAWNIDVWIFCADLSIFCKSESLMSELQLGDWNSFGDGGYLHLEMIGDGRRQFQVCQKVFTNYSTEPLFVAKVYPCMSWPWASISLPSVCSLRLAHAFSFVPEIDGIQALIKRQLLALLSLYHTVPEAVIQTFVLPPIKI